MRVFTVSWLCNKSVEETSTTELKITGELPRELSGLFLRNGPNPKEPINHENYHPFFGDGMIHGIRVEDGKALWYKNKFVTSPFGFGPNTHVLKHGEKIVFISTWSKTLL